MAHRAPDGCTFWLDGPVGLGHGSLLTLPVASLETLPLVDADLTICADVRLDNRDQLLAALGLADRSIGDAALIAAAYRSWGTDCPQRLLGDFAFALWDSRQAMLFCARDHMGVKPFCYYLGPNHIAFASEIKALLALPSTPRQIDEANIAAFLAAMVPEADATAYRGIFRLPAGHHLTVTPLGTRVQAYWRPEAAPSISLVDPVGQFRDLLSDAVRCRLHGAGSVGALLSGGLDSSSVACLAARFLKDGNKRLTTFSVVFDETPAQSERRFIEAVVVREDLDSCYVSADRLDPFADFDQVITEQDGLALAPGLAITRQAYRAAAQGGVKVVLDGHGGDEVVSHGYGRLKELAAAGQWLSLWREASAEADVYASSSLSVFGAYLTHFGSSARVLHPLGRLTTRTLRRIRRLRGIVEARPAWNRFINPEFAARTDVAQRYRAKREALAQCITEPQQHLDAVSAPLQAYALEVLDRTAAAAGIEVRYPFWDKRLVEFCLALPSEAKLSDGWSRAVLRRAMEGTLPPLVQWRRDKFDFTPHLARGMLAHRRAMLDRILFEDADDIGGYVDLPAARAAYRRLLRRAEAASGLDIQAVWRIAALALWLRRQRGTVGEVTAA